MVLVLVVLLTSTVKRQQVLGQRSMLKATSRVACSVWKRREGAGKIIALSC